MINFEVIKSNDWSDYVRIEMYVLLQNVLQYLTSEVSSMKDDMDFYKPFSDFTQYLMTNLNHFVNI